MDQLQPITSTIPEVQMVPVGSAVNMPPIQSLKPNEQMRLLDPTHYGNGSQNASMGSSGLHTMPMANYSGFQQMTGPNNDLGEIGAMFSKSQNVQMPVKRKSPMENLPVYPLSPRDAMPHKTVQLEHRPWLSFYAPNQSNPQHQMQSGAGILASEWAAKKKRTTQFQPGPPKSSFMIFPNPKNHPSQGHPSPGVHIESNETVRSKLREPSFMIFPNPKSHSSQGHPSPRVHNESNETVRSKLRESISAALALVIQQDKSSTKQDVSGSVNATASLRMQDGSKSAEMSLSVSPVDVPHDNPKGASEDCTIQIENNVESQPTAFASNVDGPLQALESAGRELNMSDTLPDEESIVGNFFGKDDLLQGNGLSWVFDFDAWVTKEEDHDPKTQKVGENADGAQEVKEMKSPQTLALQIELELFKLFGGVNKKYKEKGRSLLFNLKDRNNPELREKVMSGEISPARLCLMTPEELASKELSEWRMAKAEEFEQMKILPDSDVDIRRLVKKTHKGEFQVEVEEYDVSVEVSVGSSSVPRIQTDDKEKETKSPSDLISGGDQKETVNEKNNSEEKNLNCTITVPSNVSNDYLQGLIEDELKDPEFLPPIVSLDEFMESLHSEPPFEKLSADTENKMTSSNNDHPESEAPTATKSAKTSPDDITDVAKASPDGLMNIAKPNRVGLTSVVAKTQDFVDLKDLKLDAKVKPIDNQPQTDVSPPLAVSKGEQIWEGSLQLSSSSTILASGFFKSGEKASTKDWPRTIEVKGRVRLDAFEKFLHDLYRSRSRAIMVMHVILKESEGKDSKALNQVVDSYVADDRVGYAEPIRGLEAYLCPCHPKILDRISKHLAKDQSKTLYLADGDRGLVGVLVWRKAHQSPNSSSNHKHSLKKHQQEQNTSSRRHNHHHQDRNMNANPSNLKPKRLVTPLDPSSKGILPTPTPVKATTDEADLPPGFGPSSSQDDDDDLPEFNFSSGLSRPVPTPEPLIPQTQIRPEDEMRQLIQKYGNNAGSSLVVKPWDDDDDDDDIPEWQPQVPLPPAPHNQPMLQHLINQQEQLLRLPSQPPQVALPPPPPLAATQRPIAPSWPPQEQQQQIGLWMNPQAPPQGQFYGTQSRGF